MPNITNLTLGSPTCANLQCVTFLSLVSLSKTCGDLETLEIKVDFQTMVTHPLPAREDGGTDTIPDETRGDCYNRRLRRLGLGLSILPDHPDAGWLVAVGLGKIFPFVSRVEGCGIERASWEQVEKNIRMSREVLRAVSQ